MKYTILALTFIFYTCSSYSQITAEKRITNSTLDSLILSLANPSTLNNTEINSGKFKSASANPCDTDIDNLKYAFENLKKAYIKCCNNQSTDLPVFKAISSIYLILNNSKCKWEDHPLMYAVLLWYWSDYNSLVTKLNCKNCSTSK